MAIKKTGVFLGFESVEGAVANLHGHDQPHPLSHAVLLDNIVSSICFLCWLLFCLAAQRVLEHHKHPSGYATKENSVLPCNTARFCALQMKNKIS